MNILLLHQRARKMQVQIDIGANASGGDGVRLKAESHFSVTFANDKEHCLATITEKIESVDSPADFYIEVEMEGEFETGRIECEDDRIEAHMQSYYALFPYVQQLIAQLSIAAGVAPLMIKPERISKEDVISGNDASASE